MSEKITYMCMTTPDLDKLRRNMPLVLPYVDEAVIVIGKKDQMAIDYLKGLSKVKIVYHPWQDSFRDQYQVGLNEISGGWVNIMDDDEVPSEAMLRSFPSVIEESKNGENFDFVEFPCIDVCGEGQRLTDYHRVMFYKWNPGLHYEINLHQALVGLRRGARSNTPYYHFKDNTGSNRGACRNYWTAGVWADHKESFEYWYKETGQDPRFHPGGPLVPNPHGLAYPLRDGFRTDSWMELRALVKEHHPEVLYFHDLVEIITKKQLHLSIIEWAVRNNEENDKRPHIGEQHAVYRYLKEFGYYE